MRRKNKKKEHKINESWLLPYSDLMTLLLALFIVLFAMSQIDAVKYNKLSQVLKGDFTGGQGILERDDGPRDLPVKIPDEPTDHEAADNEKEKAAEEMTNLKEIQKKIETYIHKNKLEDVFGTKLTGEGLLITILNDVTFDPGSAHVNKRGTKIAHKIAEMIYSDPPRKVIISGHTDDIPMHNKEFASNWELSAIRAIHFMNIILDNGHLNPTNFSIKGYSKYHPAAPNTNTKNRTKNRRIEVLVLPNVNIDHEK